jgi:DNA-binding response OmpR family regulator
MTPAATLTDSKRTVLLVEDDPDQLLLRALLFERYGFASLKAEDGISAARLAADQHPDCIVMDLCIPTEQEGLALIQTVSALPKRPEIIILTGRHTAALKTRPDLRHIAAFVEKGSPTASLIAVVARVCGIGG